MSLPRRDNENFTESHVSFVIPLLMVAVGFGLILDKKLGGTAWLLVAGVVSKIGTIFLRRAEGMKFNALRSGEYRNRALRIARGMNESPPCLPQCVCGCPLQPKHGFVASVTQNQKDA